MRAADISDKPNWGGWDASGTATMDHLGYGAYRAAWNDVADVESRIRSIVSQTR
jgi:hypothetical protein